MQADVTVALVDRERMRPARMPGSSCRHDMNVTQDLDIFTLILNASIVVKVVMLLLLLVSFMSWMFIFQEMVLDPAAPCGRRRVRRNSGAART